MAAEQMTEYERKRLENIKRNSEMIASLKIHSHLSQLSASSKPLREEKSYKLNSERKRPKPESPLVIRRSLRTRGMPPDTSGLPETFNESSVKPFKSSPMKVSLVTERDPMPLGPLGMEETYEGQGSHLTLIQKLARLTCMTQSDAREICNSNSCTKFPKFELEVNKPYDPCSLKVEDNNVVPSVSGSGRRNTRSATGKTRTSDSDTEFARIKLEESVDLYLLKQEDDGVVPVRRSPRSTGNISNSDSHTEFETEKSEHLLNSQSLKLKEDNVVPAVCARRSTRSGTRGALSLNSCTEFERVKLEEPIDPRLLKLENDNIAPPVPGRTKTQSYARTCNSYYEFERVKLEEPINPRSLRLHDDNIARVVPGRIFNVRFFPTTNMTMVVAGNKYGHLGFWDVKPQYGEEEDVIHLYRPHLAPVSGISVHPLSLSKVYSSCYDGFLRMMDIETEKFEPAYTSTNMVPIYSLGHRLNDVNSFYLGEGPGSVVMLDQRVGRVSMSWPLHVGRINSIDFSPANTNIMATSSRDGFACLWDLRNMDVKITDKHHKHRAMHTVKHARAVHSAYFSPSGSCLATTSLDNNIGVLRGSSFEDTFMIPHDNWTNRWVSSFRAVWGWDDTHLYIGNMKRRVDILSVTMKKNVYELVSSNMSAIPCRYDAHPYNVGMLAGGTSGGQVYIWTASV